MTMWWPQPESVLYFMGAFLSGWAASLIWRGIAHRIVRDRRKCPACHREMPPSMGLACGACHNVAHSEDDLFTRKIAYSFVVPGIMVLGLGLSAFVGGLLVQVWVYERPFLESEAMWTALALGVGCFGATLCIWSIHGERSNGRRRCPKCWYEMRSPGPICSECGFTARHSRDLYRSRRRWNGAVLGLLVMGAGAVLTVVPRFLASGWVGLFPTTVLIAGFENLPDSLINRPAPNANDDATLLCRCEGTSYRLWAWQRSWLLSKSWQLLVHPRSPADVQRAGEFIAYMGNSPTVDYRQVANTFESYFMSDETAKLEIAAAMLENYALVNIIRADPVLVTKLLPHAKVLLSNPNPAISDAGFFLCTLSADDSLAHYQEILKLMHGRGNMARQAGFTTAIRIAANNPDALDALIAQANAADPALQDRAIVLLANVKSLQISDDALTRITKCLLSLVEAQDDKVALHAAGSVMFIEPTIDRAWEAVLNQAASDRANAEQFIPDPSSGILNVEKTVGQIIRNRAKLTRLLRDDRPAVRAAALRLLAPYRIKASDLGPVTAALEGIASGSDAEQSAIAKSIQRAAAEGQSQAP